MKNNPLYFFSYFGFLKNFSFYVFFFQFWFCHSWFFDKILHGNYAGNALNECFMAFVIALRNLQKIQDIEEQFRIVLKWNDLSIFQSWSRYVSTTLTYTGRNSMIVIFQWDFIFGRFTRYTHATSWPCRRICWRIEVI